MGVSQDKSKYMWFDSYSFHQKLFNFYFQTDFFAASTMTKVVQRVDCTGNEERLEDCTVKVARGSCSRATSVAGVICTTGEYYCSLYRYTQ